jgi:hypothetical protein
VTYRPSVGEMGNFPKFISKAIEEHGTDKGGILIIPPVKPSNTFGTHVCRGDRTHVGHCSKLDSIVKYRKNCFKILDFTRIVLDVMMLDPV